jgi:hypothetical protein
MAVFMAAPEKRAMRGILGVLVQNSRLFTIISSDPSHPSAVQKRALLAAISKEFQSLARHRRSVIAKYRQRIDVGL